MAIKFSKKTGYGRTAKMAAHERVGNGFVCYLIFDSGRWAVDKASPLGKFNENEINRLIEEALFAANTLYSDGKIL